MQLNKSAEARRWLDLAMWQLEAGFADEALEPLRWSLALEPNSAAARLLEARVQLARHQPRRALTALEAHDQAEPSLASAPQPMMLRAQALVQAGEHDAGMTLLEQLVSDLPDDIRPHRMIAAVALQCDQPDRAVTHLRQVLRLAPSDRVARRTLARLLSRQDPQQAADLLCCGSDQPPRPDERLTTARLYHQTGRDCEAEDLFSELLAERPDDAALWMEAGVLSDTMGEHRIAIARLRRSVELGQYRYIAAIAALAHAHMHAGDFTSAGRCWWRLTRVDADDARAWAGLIVCALLAERRQLIRRALNGLERVSSRWQRRKHLAEQWLHAAGGRTYRQAVVGLPAAPPLRSPLQQMLHKAAQTLTTHTTRFPRRADSHLHLGVCQEALGDLPAAAESAQHALAINPRYQAARELAQRTLSGAPQIAEDGPVDRNDSNRAAT